MNNDTANDIQNFFGEIGGAVKIAGAKRNNEIVEKQGYVGFRKLEAAELYKSQHPDWVCKIEDGEYRFYPPVKDIYTDLIDNFKEVNNNFYGLVTVQVILLDDNKKCRYILKTVDKSNGRENIVNDCVVDFEGDFLYKVLPSIYYALSKGMPVNDNMKDSAIFFDNLDQSRLLQLGNLAPEQINLVYDMKKFVDQQLGLDIPEDTNKRF